MNSLGADIEDAIAGTCEVVDVDAFTCECDSGFIWEPVAEVCTDHMCDPDPCGLIVDAIPDTCTPVGEDAFSCECGPGLGWEIERMRCTSCEEYRDCLLDCSPLNINFNFCITSCNNDYDLNCDCEFGFQNPDYIDCRNQCNLPLDQLQEYLCSVNCFFDACLLAE